MMSEPKKRSRGNLSSFLSAGDSAVLPQLQSSQSPGRTKTTGATGAVTSSSSKIRSIATSINFDVCKERILPERQGIEAYFLNNVITPSESQKVVQLLDSPQHHRLLTPPADDGPDPGHKHHQHALSNSNSHSLSNSNSNSLSNSRSSRSNQRSAASPPRHAFASHDTAQEHKRYQDVHKHTHFNALNRRLLADIFNGTDDNSAVFLAATTRESASKLDESARLLETLSLKSFPTPGNREDLMSRAEHRMQLRQERTEAYCQRVRACTTEARARNKAFIDSCLEEHEKERRFYGACPTEEDDLAGDQEFLERVQRSRTASAAVLRQTHSLRVFPFAIQEFLDSLHSDAEKSVTYSSSTALIDPCASRTYTRTQTLTSTSSTRDDAASDSGQEADWDEEDGAVEKSAGATYFDGDAGGGGEEEENDFAEEENSVISLEDDRIASINLRNWGLADSRALCLAAALPSCPALRHLDIAGNRLTDSSCAPILQAVLVACHSLRYLNLSDNKLDDRSIVPLRAKLASSACTIESLHLAKSDVDDEECAEFMDSMRTNASVRLLNLSNNKIGEMEEHLTVFPSFVTGAMAIAAAFEANHTLTELNLSWNAIRKESALVLVKSFAHNHTLHTLNLSHNHIGDRACQYLGHALRTNKTLTKVDLSYNGIMPKGVVVLATALETHRRMRHVALNGNCVGELGAKALLRTMRLAASDKRKLKISFRDANVHFQDRALFNRHEPPQGNYTLTLSDPYDFMVASCLFEAYNGKLGAKFKSLQYRAPEARTWDKIPLKRPETGDTSNAAWTPHLKAVNGAIDAKIGPAVARLSALRVGRGGFEDLAPSSSSSESSSSSDPEAVLQQQLVAHRAELTQAITALCTQLGLKLPFEVASHIAAILETLPPGARSQIHMLFKIIFRTVFRIVDRDQSDSVDQEELTKCLSLLGVSIAASPELCADYARRMIAGVDVDGSASLDEGEFVRMLFVTYTETYPESPLPLVDARTQTAWRVPQCGELQVDFVSEKLPPSLDDLQSDDAVKAISGSLQGGGGDADGGAEGAIKSTVCDDMFITCEQAEILLQHFRNPHVDNKLAKRNAVECFVPQMTTAVEACRFLAQNLSLREIFRLRRKWGGLLSAITGLACGHFHINLNNDIERRAAKRLAQLNSLSKSKASLENPTRDTSQNGDFENFRNASHNARPFALTSAFFSEIPHMQVSKLRFDFVNVNRPVPGIEACSGDGIESMIEAVFSPDLEHDGEEEDEPLQEEQEDDDDPWVIAERARKAAEEQAAEEERKAKEAKKKTGLLAGLKRQEELSRVAQAKLDEKLNRKVESLHTITERALNEGFRTQWQSLLDSTREMFLLAHTDSMQEALRAAAIDAGESLSSLAKDGPSAAVLASKIYRDARARPASSVDVSRYLERVRKAARLAKRAHQHTKADGMEDDKPGSKVDRAEKRDSAHKHKGGKKKHAAAGRGGDAAEVLSVPEREQLVSRCMRFEKNLQLLESYLIYNMWVSAEQALQIARAFEDREAPEAVIVRCVCVLFSRTIDLENLLPALAGHFGPLLVHEASHRLGVLNLLSPALPDGQYELDLSAADERAACMLLLRLAVIEAPFIPAAATAAAVAAGGGDTSHPLAHFVAPDYRRSAAEPWANGGRGAKGPGAGWLVPLAWREGDPGGPPKAGTVRFSFRATHDAGLPDENGEEEGEEAGQEEGDAEVETEDAETSSMPRFAPNPAARAELMAFRCLAGTKGTFIKGAPADTASTSTSSNSNSTNSFANTSTRANTADTDALISDADWGYVSRVANAEDEDNQHHASEEPYLDVVGYAPVYFGAGFKLPPATPTDKFLF